LKFLGLANLSVVPSASLAEHNFRVRRPGRAGRRRQPACKPGSLGLERGRSWVSCSSPSWPVADRRALSMGLQPKEGALTRRGGINCQL
jgi:hypothetical protein